jgi:hypothetical protein
MQCACAILSSVVCPALQCSSTFTHKRHDFRGKEVLSIKCFISLQVLFENFLIISRTERDVIKNVYRSSCNVNRYSCPILMKLEFSRQIFYKRSILNLIKFRPVWGELFHADRRTVGRTNRHDEARSSFSILLKRLKVCTIQWTLVISTKNKKRALKMEH